MLPDNPAIPIPTQYTTMLNISKSGITEEQITNCDES
jgi:hypothetical protein